MDVCVLLCRTEKLPFKAISFHQRMSVPDADAEEERPFQLSVEFNFV